MIGYLTVGISAFLLQAPVAAFQAPFLQRASWASTVSSNVAPSRVPFLLSTVEDGESAVAENVEVEAAPVAEEPASAAPKEEGFKVYIGNLPFEETQENLESIFGSFGEVTNVFIPTNRETGAGRGFGFITMTDADAARAAISELDKSEVGGRTVYVNMADEKPKRETKPRAPREDPTKSKLYIGNISFETTEADLKNHFEQFGTVHDCYIPSFPNGDSRGFAFVTLDADKEDIAIEGSNGIELVGRIVTVSKSKANKQDKTRGKSAPTTKLFVGNLSYYTDAATLREIFEEFGVVVDCYVPANFDYEGQNRGFAFVTMAEGDAANAMEQLNDMELDGREIRINEAQQDRKKSNRQSQNDDDWGNSSSEGDWAAN